MNEVRKSSVPRCVKVHESAFSFLIHPRHKHPWKIASLRTDELVFGDFLSRRWPSLRNETIDDDSSETLLIVTARNILVIGPNSFLRLSQQRDDRSREWEEFCHWEIFQGMGFLHDDSCELLRIIMGRVFSGILLNLFTILLYEKCIFTYIQRFLIITERGNKKRFIYFFLLKLKKFFNDKGTRLTRKWSREEKKRMVASGLIYHLAIHREIYLLQESRTDCPVPPIIVL